MTLDQAIMFGLLALALALFLWNRWRHDVVAFAVLILAVILGVVPTDRAFDGFGHPATITVAAVLVLSHALTWAGALEGLATLFSRMARTLASHIAVLSGLGALLSGFMNNVAALGLMMPAAIKSTETTKYGAGAVLMPLSFGTILGGLVTMVGTPPNIIIANIRGESTGTPFQMFDFTPVGLAVAVVGVLFLALFSKWFLPKRRLIQTATKDHLSIEKFVMEARVPKTAEIHGMSAAEVTMLAIDSNIFIVAFIQKGRRYAALPRGKSIQGNDILVLEGSPEDLDNFVTSLGLAVGKGEFENLYDDDLDFLEAVVRPGSRLLQRRLGSINLRRRFEVNILAISRAGTPTRGRLSEFQCKEGDLILFYGHRDHLPEAAQQLGCLPLESRGIQLTSVTGELKKAAPATLIFAAGIALAAFGILHISVALGLAAVAMVVSGILPARQLYTGIDWPVVVLIAALIPVGAAFEWTGTSALVAESLLRLPLPPSPELLLGVVMVMTMLISAVLSNAATAVVMAPISVTLAQAIGANPDSFLMSVAIGASCAFLTPIGHQNNALVMGPGGYAFNDYWRLGLPLQILIVLVAMPMILWVWPL